MIILHQFEISPFCDKIRRIMNWKEIEYQVQEVPVAKMSGIKKYNPAGKVPVIEHNGTIVCDSTDIAYYLEEKFPEKPLLPNDPAERALIHFLEDWADESLYFHEMYLRFALPHNLKRTVDKLLHADNKLVQKIAPLFVPFATKSILNKQGLGTKPEGKILDDIERHVSSMSGFLGSRDWLVGGALSLADISVFAQLYCIKDSDEGDIIIGGYPTVVNWMGRVDQATGK